MSVKSSEVSVNFKAEIEINLENGGHVEWREGAEEPAMQVKNATLIGQVDWKRFPIKKIFKMSCESRHE